VSQAEPASGSGPEATQEGELVAASARGDQDAFRQLVERYRRLVLHVAYRSMGDMSLAEDVAQEAFIKVYRGLPKYRPEKPFVHWLHRVVANAVTDELRRRRPVTALDDEDTVAAPAADDPQTTVEARAVQQAVRDAVAKLPEPYRDVIILRAFDELSCQQIALTLRLPLSTVMWRLNMAKRLLRKQLGEDTAGAEGDTSSTARRAA
jgi:RNA polymerase sigma-70 factor (ECF subfamily)